MVEKRIHPIWALLWNQTMYATISFVIVTTMSGVWKQVFGVFFLTLFLSGVYGYAKKAGNGHQKSYSTIKPHIKFPTAYALVAVGWFIIPIGIAYLAKHWLVQLLVIFWESPFFFGNIISMQGFCFPPMAIFGALIFVTPYLGYLAGVKQFSITPYVVKLLYRPADDQNDKTKK